MTAEMTDKDARTAQGGWVFYDAECPLCVAGVQRIGGLFVRRGFVWKPLQGPEVAAKLGVSQSDTLGEMKLLLASGRVVGGADAWAELLRSVWWLRPLGWLMRLPGLHDLCLAAYRCLARNRYCLGGACRRDSLPPKHHRTTAFFELP